MKRFLIIDPFGIGDVLFTTPVIKAIKDAYPDSYIGYWCNERVADILINNPTINRVFAFSRGDLKKFYQQAPFAAIRKFFSLVAAIRKDRFQVCIDFSLDHRYSLICKLVGIKKRIGFNYKNRGRFLTDKIIIDGYKGKHVVEYYLELLRFLQVRPKDKGLYLFVSEANDMKAHSKLEHLGVKRGISVVGIVPGAGASWGKDASIKHWSAIKYAQLADRIASEFKAKVIILGDESERAIADIMVSAMKNKAIDFTGKTNLEELAAIISQLDLLITNDGGPLHMAVALDKKTVSIFGPVDESVYGPYPASKNHIVIKKDLSCRPCYNNFRFQGCFNNRECIDSVSVEDVLRAVRILL